MYSEFDECRPVFRWLSILAQLGKVKITVAVTATAAMGFILAGGSTGIVTPLTGIFFLGCGAAALNQYQERETDALMLRTRNRPIPSGLVSKGTALILSAGEIGVGASLLFMSGISSLVLGLSVLFWYNGVYTPLKRKTAWAAVPGGVIGAIPPVIGWTAAGGDPLNPEILVVASFLFVWQVPHFWLLMVRYREDYERSRLPLLTHRYSPAKIMRLILAWVIATIGMCMGSVLVWALTPCIFWTFFAGSICLFWLCLKVGSRPGLLRAAFTAINIYAVLLIVILPLHVLRSLWR